jgi:hypothetical protein
MDDRPRSRWCDGVGKVRFAALGRWTAACSVVAEMSLPGTHIEIDFTEDGDEAAAEARFAFCDEQTVRFNFDKPNLTPDDRLIVGYLLMEEHGLFGALSLDEQQRVAASLKR